MAAPKLNKAAVKKSLEQKLAVIKEAISHLRCTCFLTTERERP